mgnify:FL=1
MRSKPVKVGNRAVSKAISVSAPTGGINDTSPMAAMEPNFCLSLVNMFPGNEALRVRGGSRVVASGLSGSVKTLIPYTSLSGSHKLFAATDAGVYDVTNAVSSPAIAHTLISGNVDFVQFSNPAGNFLVCTNSSTDPTFYYDGTSFHQFSMVAPGTIGAGMIWGADPTTFDKVTAAKHRLWFAQANSMTAWYLPLDSLGGEATPFYLGGIFKQGGYLYEIATWSLDSGAGLDDLTVFISSNGEVAVYTGSDPDDASTWRINSVYLVSPPVGKIPTIDMGGDLIMMTEAGLFPLSKVVQGAAAESLYESALSRNISRTLNSIIHSTSGIITNDWELHNFTSIQTVLISIPDVDGSARQYIMNASTGAWAEYRMDASCFGNMAGSAYFGTGDGRVYRHGNDLYMDNIGIDGTGGTPISCSLMSAFSYFNSPTAIKHFKLVRPIVQTAVNPGIALGLAIDFSMTADGSGYSPGASAVSTSLWNSAIWDASQWAFTSGMYRPWTSVTGLGYAASLIMAVTTSVPCTIVASEFIFETGGMV